MTAAPIVWLTGISGAGKTTIATNLRDALDFHDIPAVIVDGDDARRQLCSDLGFSASDRSENVRRLSSIANMISAQGLFVIVACIAPRRKDRAKARRTATGKFVEVYVEASWDACLKRDPKKLYSKNSAVMAKSFGHYEAPEFPDLELPTEKLSAEDCVDRILDYLRI